MQTCDHLLAKYGVMSNFSIAKKVTPLRIKKLSERLNTKDEYSEEFQDELKKEILKETQLAMFNNTIPGLITNSKKPINSKTSSILLTEKEKKKITLMTTILLRAILEKDLSKDETCLLIVQLVGGLGLKDTDFSKFNKTYNQSDEEDDFEDEDGEEFD